MKMWPISAMHSASSGYQERVSMEYTRLTLREWEALTTATHKKFVEKVMGKAPTFKTVAATLPNPFIINALEWVAMLVLVVLTLFTSFKVGAVAQPFSIELLADLRQKTYMSDIIV